MVAPEDVLRPIAVVDVPVEDGDPVDPEVDLGETRRDGHVREDAEAHRAARQRVVARRADEREAAALGDRDRAARGEAGGLVGRRRAEGVLVELDRAAAF